MCCELGTHDIPEKLRSANDVGGIVYRLLLSKINAYIRATVRRLAYIMMFKTLERFHKNQT